MKSTISKFKSIVFAIVSVFVTIFSTPVATVFFTVLNPSVSSAQFLTGTHDPIYDDHPSFPATHSSVTVRNTGDDVVKDVLGFPVHTWVCDGDTPTISWGVWCTAGCRKLADTLAMDPDVAIVANSVDTLWAIVAYYAPNNSGGAYVWEAFRWNSGSQSFGTSFSGQHILEKTKDKPDSLVNTVNVDAAGSNFVIVWQDTAAILADIGSAALAGPSIISSPAPQKLYKDTIPDSLESFYTMCPNQYTSPDVSIYLPSG